MIGLPELFKAATVAPPEGDAASATVIDRFLLTLPGRRPKMPSTTARLVYPGNADYKAIRAQLLAVARSRPDLVAAVEQTLVKPLRAYPLGSEASRRFALISSYKDACVIMCEVDVSGIEPAMSARIIPAADRVTLARSLEALYPKIVTAARSGDHIRASSREVMFVADPGRVGAELAPGWKQAISAIGESWGHGVVFNETPITNGSSTMREFDRFGGFAVIIVPSAAGSFGVETARHPRWRHQTVELDRLASPALYDDLRVYFQLGLVEPPRVESWVQFAARSDELEAEYFVLVPRCREALESCAYYDPARLWDFAARLSEGARRKLVAGWAGAGSIAPWMSQSVGLEIALSDSGLGDTSFEYEGVELSWEPHVKVDDAKDEPTRLGRIYFATDDENERLVVWHIGLHL